MKSITIHNMEPELDHAIDALAKKTGLSTNKTIKLLLRQALEIDESGKPKRDLSKFYGIWSEAEAKEFNEATSVFNKVDDELWS